MSGFSTQSDVNVWKVLSEIDVNGHTEKKGNLTYLSWAWAWGELKNHFPRAQYEKHYFDQGGLSVPYAVDANGFAFVMVTVTVEGLSHTETLPVLDHKNKPVNQPDAFQINTSLQRCLAKAIAMHGLGHYIYAGEDLPNVVPFAQDEIEAFGTEMRLAMEQGDFMKVARSLINPDNADIWQKANQGTPNKGGGQFTSKQKALQSEMVAKFKEQVQEWANEAIQAASEGYTDAVMEIVSDIDPVEKTMFWSMLNEETKQLITKEKAAA